MEALCSVQFALCFATHECLGTDKWDEYKKDKTRPHDYQVLCDLSSLVLKQSDRRMYLPREARAKPTPEWNAEHNIR